MRGTKGWYTPESLTDQRYVTPKDGNLLSESIHNIKYVLHRLRKCRVNVLAKAG